MKYKKTDVIRCTKEIKNADKKHGSQWPNLGVRDEGPDLQTEI